MKAEVSRSPRQQWQVKLRPTTEDADGEWKLDIVKQGPKPRPNYFVSLRVRSPAILSKIDAMRIAQCEQNPALKQY
eukprot:SAG31_NODE_15117_length_770_cov_0.983607_1_plen_75_part_01